MDGVTVTKINAPDSLMHHISPSRHRAWTNDNACKSQRDGELHSARRYDSGKLGERLKTGGLLSAGFLYIPEND